ncbi:hypothetical protein [Aporhodopirellula aestuarii]|uniref:Uncharacterized protein n=1 Tax=Aporhodopirellula aestuarii TaxID=2950107 RepID=A0ABT0U4H4_9BACT|nr:hypothetical protein [Aporhodopirellula aestuarii]MCM2371246.1 hypothetical protein [Aporhodopirellula aestuarii]
MRSYFFLIGVLCLVFAGVLMRQPQDVPDPVVQTAASDISDPDESYLPVSINGNDLELDLPQSEPIEITFEHLHHANTEGFANADGFGLSRGGRHVLMGDEAVRFLEDAIIDAPDLADQTATNPYGLWGALGARAESKVHPELKAMADPDLAASQSPVWRLDSVQVVSLDRFESPVAYDEEELPTMDAIKNRLMPTRSLSPFELEAVKKLRNGDELVSDRNSEQLVLVGAIRANNACVDCHAAKPLDLLGAFTYHFSRQE